MKDIIDSLAKLSNAPLSFLMFGVGAGFLLLGVIQGISGTQVVDPLRPVAIGLGLLLLACAVILYLVSQKARPAETNADRAGANEKLGASPLPMVEGDGSKHQLPAAGDLTPAQRKILRYIEDRTGQWMEQDEINKAFGLPEPEVYYRLEQLRLLGFIDRHLNEGTAGISVTYDLSRAYKRVIGGGAARAT